MERLVWIIVLLIVGAAIGVLDYAGYRSLKEMRGELRSLRQEVNEATRMAQEESAATAAASRSAQEAAARAATAAEGRKQAESGRQQAETAAQQANQATREAQERMSEMVREREEELNHMQEALNRVVETRRTPNGIVISLPSSIFRFDFDKADLNQQNRELLSRIAGILLISKAYGLSVFGYTDDVGTVEYNRQLSLRRANSVKDYLVQAGLDPAIINVKGYGKTSPRVEGTSDEDRSKNRRVEIALTDSSIRFQ
ncbi:MAG: OmpA family protein [Acidobacteriaceae bacterium]|nr:OmpA family protein [Acidobacteriaceae bacterium]